MVLSKYGNEEVSNTLWVFLEHDQHNLAGVSLELLSRGRQMADEAGWQLVGLLIGQDVAKLSDVAIAHGADEVVLVEHDLLELFTVEAFTAAAYQAIEKKKPSIFLLGATANGRDMAGRLAVRLKTGLNADCTGLHLDEKRGVLVSEVTGFGGGIIAYIEMQEHRPQMATVRPGVFTPGEADTKRKGKVTSLTVELKKDLIVTRLIDRVVGEGVDLTQTPALVVGGRGIEGEFAMMEKLADLLLGDVGATRPPVDDGYIERERQIGQTGVVCRPKVAITCGVSGAFHFVVGIQEADIVIAINTDPEAPIFDFADYCIVGDALEVVPALIKNLEENLVVSNG